MNQNMQSCKATKQDRNINKLIITINKLMKNLIIIRLN